MVCRCDDNRKNSPKSSQIHKLGKIHWSGIYSFLGSGGDATGQIPKIKHLFRYFGIHIVRIELILGI